MTAGTSCSRYNSLCCVLLAPLIRYRLDTQCGMVNNTPKLEELTVTTGPSRDTERVLAEDVSRIGCLAGHCDHTWGKVTEG